MCCEFGRVHKIIAYKLRGSYREGACAAARDLPPVSAPVGPATDMEMDEAPA